MFVPPPHLIVLETVHWRINQRVEAKVPGYLMMAPRDSNAVSFATIHPNALMEMGPVLARVTRAIEDHLHPQYLYVSRYGHMADHNLHLHIIPVYKWMAEAFRKDARYRILQQFYTPGVYTSAQDNGFDGAEMTLFIWRELVESSIPPDVQGPTVAQGIEMLRLALRS